MLSINSTGFKEWKLGHLQEIIFSYIEIIWLNFKAIV